MTLGSRYSGAMRGVGIITMYLFAACEGNIVPPQQTPPAPAGSTLRSCPPIPTQLGPCGDLHLVNARLSCGGNGSLMLATGSIAGGGLHVEAQLANGTTLSGNIVTPDPACVIKDGRSLDLVFGVTYTADQGLEAGTGTPCIVQSKVDYSQIHFIQEEFNPHIPAMRDLLHRTLDTELLKSLFPAATGRCARWRWYRKCGDGVVDTGETCDDGNTVAGDGCGATCTGP